MDLQHPDFFKTIKKSRIGRVSFNCDKHRFPDGEFYKKDVLTKFRGLEEIEFEDRYYEGGFAFEQIEAKDCITEMASCFAKAQKEGKEIKIPKMPHTFPVCKD